MYKGIPPKRNRRSCPERTKGHVHGFKASFHSPKYIVPRPQGFHLGHTLTSVGQIIRVSLLTIAIILNKRSYQTVSFLFLSITNFYGLRSMRCTEGSSNDSGTSAVNAVQFLGQAAVTVVSLVIHSVSVTWNCVHFYATTKASNKIAT